MAPGSFLYSRTMLLKDQDGAATTLALLPSDVRLSTTGSLPDADSHLWTKFQTPKFGLAI